MMVGNGGSLSSRSVLASGAKTVGFGWSGINTAFVGIATSGSFHQIQMQGSAFTMTLTVEMYQDRVKEVLDLTTDNDRLRTALRRIRSLEEKNVPKYAQQIAREALTLPNGELT